MHKYLKGLPLGIYGGQKCLELCPPGLLPLTGTKHVRTCNDLCPLDAQCIQVGNTIFIVLYELLHIVLHGDGLLFPGILQDEGVLREDRGQAGTAQMEDMDPLPEDRALGDKELGDRVHLVGTTRVAGEEQVDKGQEDKVLGEDTARLLLYSTPHWHIEPFGSSPLKYSCYCHYLIFLTELFHFDAFYTEILALLTPEAIGAAYLIACHRSCGNL